MWNFRAIAHSSRKDSNAARGQFPFSCSVQFAFSLEVSACFQLREDQAVQAQQKATGQLMHCMAQLLPSKALYSGMLTKC